MSSKRWSVAVAALIALAAGACSPSLSDPAGDGPAPMVDGTAQGRDAGLSPTDAAPPAADAAPSPPARTFNGPLFLRRAEAGELATFALDQVAVAASGELVLASGGGHPGQDPYPPGAYNGGNYYNGGRYRYGAARSSEWISATPFEQVIPSFEAATPPGTWVEIALAVRRAGRWSKDYVLGVWASGTETVARHSVDGQDDVDAEVAIDTLVVNGTADALRFTVRLFSETPAASPRVRRVGAVVSASGAVPAPGLPTPAARGKVLDVPQRSQLLYPDGAELCSPTSTSMLLGYWAARLGRPELAQAVPAVEQAVFDHGADIRGNWTFNMAHAASTAGGALHAAVTRLSSLYQVEQLIAADVPVGISVASTTGHLLVVRGFTPAGDVVCNDPALPSDAEVRVTYGRAELEDRWLSHSQGVTYLMWPAGVELAADPLGAY